MRKKPYKTPFLDNLVREAWEILPVYSGEQQDLRVAVGLGEGSCMQRSAIIGRKALEVGVPAMRSIYFGPDNMPTNFRSVLFVDRVWVCVSTDHTSAIYNADRQYRAIPASTVSWSMSLGGELVEMDEVRPAPSSMGEIMIPEIAMRDYRHAESAEDYINIQTNIPMHV